MTLEDDRAMKYGLGPIACPRDAARYRDAGLPNVIEIRTVAAGPLQGRLYGNFEHVLPDGTVTRDATGLWGVRPVVEGDPERETADLMEYVGVDVGPQPATGARATLGPANIDAAAPAVALGGVTAAGAPPDAPDTKTALASLPGPLMVQGQMAAINAVRLPTPLVRG